MVLNLELQVYIIFCVLCKKWERKKMIFRQISAKSSLRINVCWDFKFKGALPDAIELVGVNQKG